MAIWNGPSKQVRLTSERLEELETVQDILKGLGVKTSDRTPQRAVSAAMQVFIGYVQGGGKVTYEFKDNRTAEID